jgi:hypothetical protein
VQNAPLYPEEPRGWRATLGQYWADGSAAHRKAARCYLDLDGLRGQYLSGVQDPSRIDPDDWVIDKALIDRPGVDEIMLDLLYDIPNQVPVFKAMQEFLRDRRPPTLVATGANDEIFPEAPASWPRRGISFGCGVRCCSGQGGRGDWPGMPPVAETAG